MIVDDVAMNLKVLGAMLKKNGYHVIEETSPNHALLTLKSCRPSVILTDLWMPELNGAQFAAKIREQPEWRGIPIVAVTADNDVVANFDASLFADILLKPLSLKQLNAAIRNLSQTECPATALVQ